MSQSNMITNQLTNTITESAPSLVKFNLDIMIKVVVIIAVVVLMIRLLRLYLNNLAEKMPRKRILIKNMVPLSNLLIYIAAVLLIVFGVLKIPSSVLVTLGVSAGVAIGFAIQNLLSNIFSGLVIIFTRPFNIGDKIEVGNYYGEVTDISLIRIQLQTPDDSTVTIPAKSFLEQNLSNANGGVLDCQVVTEIYLPGDVDMDKVRRLALESVHCSPYTYLKKPIAIVFKEHYERVPFIKMKVKSYVYDHRQEFAYSSDLTNRIKKAILENNIVSSSYYHLPYN